MHMTNFYVYITRCFKIKFGPLRENYSRREITCVHNILLMQRSCIGCFEVMETHHGSGGSSTAGAPGWERRGHLSLPRDQPSLPLGGGPAPPAPLHQHSSCRRGGSARRGPGSGWGQAAVYCGTCTAGRSGFPWRVPESDALWPGCSPRHPAK